MASYRYWRVKATTMHGSSSNFCAAQEVFFLTDWDGPQASGGTPISDSAYPSLPATNAFDGTNAQWASNGTGTASYIGYDFGSAVTLKEVWYTPRGDSSYLQIFTAADIDGSPDGSTWTTVVSWTPATWEQGVPQTKVVQGSKPADGTAGAGAHRYWRLLARSLPAYPAGSGQAVMAAKEVEWRLTAGGGQAATGGTPMAGTEFGGSFSADKAYDANGTTVWASHGVGLDWIGYDFGSAKQIAEMAYTSRDDASYTQIWDTAVVQSSDDGVTWTTAVGLLTAAAWSQNQTQVFTIQAAASSASARRVVFICT